VSSRPPHDAELVHELRKTIKRMRALARLLRYETGKRRLREVNDSLRSAGQRLAGERDAQVRLATLKRLTERHPEALAHPGVQLLAKRLEAEREQGHEPAGDSELLEDIAAMRETLRRWRRLDLEQAAVLHGLSRLYEEGRTRYERVLAGHTDSGDFHDWRKRVKSFYYALQMAGGKHPEIEEIARRADRLGDVLGKEHDLWMLATYLHEHADACGEDYVGREELSKLIERRRSRLRSRALKLGGKVYELELGELLELLEDSRAG
jgi:CHAD domain-containing protein